MQNMYDLKFDTEATLLSMGTIFPIVFTISESYSRREKALKYLASIKVRSTYIPGLAFA